MSTPAPFSFRATKEAIDDLCHLAMLVRLDDAKQALRELEYVGTWLPAVDAAAHERVGGHLPEHVTQVRAFVAFRAALQRLATGSERAAPGTE